VKLSPGQWCKVQETLANLNCPDCFSGKVKLSGGVGNDNVECEDCRCQFEFNPDIVTRPDLP
jgi:hypothetical protein